MPSRPKKKTTTLERARKDHGPEDLDRIERGIDEAEMALRDGLEDEDLNTRLEAARVFLRLARAAKRRGF